jgi:FkbM family methyltransferase
MHGSSLVAEKQDVLTLLKNIESNVVYVLITDDRNFLQSLNYVENLVPILIDSYSKLEVLRGSNDYLVVPYIEVLESLFLRELDAVLSLWVTNFLEVENQLKNQVSKFENKIKERGGIYIFGAGTIGRQVFQDAIDNQIEVLGFLDNKPSMIGATFLGRPILGINSLDPQNDVVVVAVGKHSEIIRSQIKEAGFRVGINLSEFFYSLASSIQPEKNYLSDLKKNRFEWLKLGIILVDKKSRQVLESIVNHRLTLDTAYLAALNDKSAKQWFDPEIISPNPEAIFVDCGAYDGDTAEDFYHFNGNSAKKIYAFEIDPEIASRASKRLEFIEQACVFSQGVADKAKTMYFHRTGITHGNVSNALTEEAEVVSLVAIDELIKDKVTYLKFDVEGAESSALIGAQQQIRENIPIIGIAVYHKASDIWSLPNQISSIKKSYRFYLRHYTDVSFESVVYACKQN